MSSMLEQAIVDAAALREAALKNAEQSIIEKYAPEIKAAVETLLETTEDTKAINEQEMSPQPEAAIEAPFAAADVSPGQEVELEMTFDFDSSEFDFINSAYSFFISSLNSLANPFKSIDSSNHNFL